MKLKSVKGKIYNGLINLCYKQTYQLTDMFDTVYVSSVVFHKVYYAFYNRFDTIVKDDGFLQIFRSVHGTALREQVKEYVSSLY